MSCIDPTERLFLQGGRMVRGSRSLPQGKLWLPNCVWQVETVAST
jgi:hypothetical protein